MISQDAPPVTHRTIFVLPPPHRLAAGSALITNFDLGAKLHRGPIQSKVPPIRVPFVLAIFAFGGLVCSIALFNNAERAIGILRRTPQLHVSHPADAFAPENRQDPGPAPAPAGSQTAPSVIAGTGAPSTAALAIASDASIPANSAAQLTPDGSSIGKKTLAERGQQSSQPPTSAVGPPATVESETHASVRLAPEKASASPKATKPKSPRRHSSRRLHPTKHISPIGRWFAQFFDFFKPRTQSAKKHHSSTTRRTVKKSGISASPSRR
jgi:hypothetical protein